MQVISVLSIKLKPSLKCGMNNSFTYFFKSLAEVLVLLFLKIDELL